MTKELPILATSGSGLVVAGVPVFMGSEEAFVDRIVKDERPCTAELVVTPNVDQLINLNENRAFRRAYRSAQIAVLDGMPLVVTARALGHAGAQRITGADLISALATAASGTEHHLVVTGGRADVAQRAAQRLREISTARISAIDFPNIGSVDDPVSLQVVEQIKNAAPTIVFLCLGSPKQELWFHHWRHELPSGTYVGAGAAVDFAAGAVVRAPAFLQRFALEWMWRLAHEPGRLWHRYLIKGPRFLSIAWRSWRHRDGSESASTKDPS